MKFIVPVPITSAMLVSSNIPESISGTPATEYVGSATITPAIWSSSTSYAIGDYCVRTSTHKIYQSNIASNLNHTPESSLTGTTPAWKEISSTNRWKMFDAFGSTQSIQSNTVVHDKNIDVDIQLSDSIDTIALIGLSGCRSVYLSVVNSLGDTYNEQTISITNKTDYVIRLNQTTNPGDTLWLSLVPSTPATTIKIAKMEIGMAFELGDINYGSSVGIIDYSKKNTDEWGNTILIKRAFTKKITAKIVIDKARLDAVESALSAYRATPLVWIGNDNLYTALIVYGFYRDFDINISYPAQSDCSLSIEGFN